MTAYRHVMFRATGLDAFVSFRLCASLKCEVILLIRRHSNVTGDWIWVGFGE